MHRGFQRNGGPLCGYACNEIRLRSSSGRERMRERRPLHFLMSRRCFFWRTRRSLIISLYSSIWSPTSRKSEKSLSSTDSISEICRVVGGWLVFERGLSAVGRFVSQGSSLSTTCSSSCSDDDMNPSVASVVLGKFSENTYCGQLQCCQITFVAASKFGPTPR